MNDICGDAAHNLTCQAKAQYCNQVAKTVFRMLTALGDHPGKDGHSQSADDTQDLILGQQFLMPQMDTLKLNWLKLLKSLM